MEMTVKEYAERLKLQYATAQTRLKRYGKRISRGRYEVDENDRKLFRPLRGIGGKPPQSEIDRMKKLAEEGLPLWAIAEKVGCCEITVWKYVR